MEKNPTMPEKLQMVDFLIPNATLSAFDLELTDETKKFLDETRQQQEELLKLKQISDEQLRMVVQL